MSLASGTRLGAYEIIALIGAGGMGEVYRARDIRLNRDVAIKMLPQMFSTDADRLARFKREAHVLASLNHPNIAHIYGVEETTGVNALILELVDGQTLADRIAEGPVPVNEALSIARQIADALEVAHAQGIVHRDLKPANIKLTANGTVKVLDFGLAKAAGPTDGPVQVGQGAPNNLSASPTITSPAMTMGGVILGTAAYMSPEQARGKAVDKRTDIWAYGCVLFEMLTGKRAFDGDAVTDVLARILEREPEFSQLPATVPAGVRTLLRRCLNKELKRRLSDIADARLEIEDASAAPFTENEAPRVLSRERLAWSAALLAIVVAVFAVLTPRSDRPATPAGLTRFTIPVQGNLFPGIDPAVAAPFTAVSPDGRHIAVLEGPPGRATVRVRSLDALESRQLLGSEGAVLPFWSPDSQAIAFFADGKIKKIGISQGSLEIVCETGPAEGGTWNRDGVVLLGTRDGGLMRVAATGGVPVRVTNAGGTGVSHRAPQFLPDGRHFLYFSHPDRTIHVGSLDSPDTRQLLQADSKAVYAPPGYLLFVRQSNLLAQPFDADRLELSGGPIQLADQVGAGQMGHAAFSASDTGALVYRQSARVGRSRLVWFDRSGQRVGGVDQEFDDRQVALSPDGHHIVLDRYAERSSNARDLWLIDTERGTTTPLLSEATDDCCPIWSPDSKRIAFRSTRDGGQGIYLMAIDSPGSVELLVKPPPLAERMNTARPDSPKDWSRDGRFLVYEAVMGTATTQRDLWIAPLFGDRKPLPAIHTQASESQGRFSPDGRRLAYMSNQSGEFEVYVQALAASARQRLQVSTSGGFYPRWRADGRELFYVSPNRKLMSVMVSDTGTLRLGVPVSLFDVPITDPRSQPYTDKYAVSGDGKRFVVVQLVSEPVIPPLTVVLNWTADLPNRDSPTR